MKQAGINAYQQQQKSSVEVEKPEQLVATLFNKLMETLAKARHYIEIKDIANKTDRINLSIDILLVLEHSLDHENGGKLAGNLQALYQYCTKCLVEANSENNTAKIDEVSNLMKEIQEGWHSIINPTTNKETGIAASTEQS